MFVLVMQFLWLWIDEFVGKGLEWYVIAQIFIYQAATLVPLALPLAVLLSTIMTFGNLGQHYELVAMKSAGISLRRISMPIFIFCGMMMVLAFYFANVQIPDAQLKIRTLLYDIQQQKPAFNIKEGLFYNQIDGYSIKVGKKDADNQNMHEVMIYDHTSNKGNVSLILADDGKMAMNEDKDKLMVTLYKGTRYEEMEDKDNNKRTYPFSVTTFGKQEIVMDLSAFKLNRSDEDFFKENYQMLNILELDEAIDSLNIGELGKRMGFLNNMSTYFHLHDSSGQQRIVKNPYIVKGKDLTANFSKSEKQKIYSAALNSTRTLKGIADFSVVTLQNGYEFENRFRLEWHRKFTLSIACIIFFFIGAPFGAIVRKGGLGMPMVSAIVIFIIYYMITVAGEKASNENVFSPFIGMWLSSFVMIPLGLFLTYKASIDSNLFNKEWYYNIARKVQAWLQFKKDKDIIVESE